MRIISRVVTQGGVEEYLNDVAAAVGGIIALSREGFQDVTLCSLVPGGVVVDSQKRPPSRLTDQLQGRLIGSTSGDKGPCHLER